MTTTTTTTAAAAAAATAAAFKYYHHHSLNTLSHPLRLRPLSRSILTLHDLHFFLQPTETTFPSPIH